MMSQSARYNRQYREIESHRSRMAGYQGQKDEKEGHWFWRKSDTARGRSPRWNTYF